MAKRSSLVCQHLENISRDALERHQDIIRQYVRGRQGVYALYRGDKLYYVGLASNLRMRLAHHMRNRHGESWNRFSVYLTIGDSHMRELEALILRIVKPKGNNQKGKFAKSEDLKRRFGRDVRERYRKEYGALLGSPIKVIKAAKVSSKVKLGGKAAVMVKYLKGRALSLRKVYKGKLYKARLRKDGSMLFQGIIYSSPTMAGKALCNHAVNGWRFWEYERAPGDWVKLEKLRR